VDEDPVVRGLLRAATGLRAGGEAAGYEVRATYWTRAGIRPFAICRDGLLIDPDGPARFIAYAEIEDAGYYNLTMIKRAKSARRGGPAGPLEIRLRNGETIALPVEIRDDGMPDLLQIAKLIHNRAMTDRPSDD
jgi:hypothetical protein